MNTSMLEIRVPAATQVLVNDDTLLVELSDGRAISAPLAWFPRLLHGTSQERSNWRLLGLGRGIHWPDLDEDISVENLLAGKQSAESQQSLKTWLAKRTKEQAQPPAAVGASGTRKRRRK